MMTDYTNTINLTENEFVAHERAVWGEDYVFDLFDRGYVVKLTDRGWRWFAPHVTQRGYGAHVCTQCIHHSLT